MGEKKLEWITIDQAAELVKDFYKKATIYQLIHKGKLHRRGPYHKAVVRKDELLRVCKLNGIIDA